VAHLDIDIYDPKKKRNKAPGFTDAERANFQKVLDLGFVDSYRHLYPEEKDKCYTYFSYRRDCKGKNYGWRLDYFVVSSELLPRVADVQIHREVDGSDHVPLMLMLH